MQDWLVVVLSVVGGVLLLWVTLVLLLWMQQRDLGEKIEWRDILRLMPDVVRLVKRLASDPSVPPAPRIWLFVLLAYLVIPVDLIPDFIPVLGYADDAIIVAIVLRFAVRHAGMAAIERHWPGTNVGLRSLLALTGAK
ncbi:YkvA family protein [Agromyces sp. Marseille-P2726]|uniref:YkvA family protein n=1 Tax=Agromyces sp. Marseille-P2726 TaxID=2709132 RepID=UPI00156FF1F2|nr:DUF1232 domain-containing protein [Agromyces sp. Marseille-P2726]